jgi:hypothetical protein
MCVSPFRRISDIREEQRIMLDENDVPRCGEHDNPKPCACCADDEKDWRSDWEFDA